MEWVKENKTIRFFTETIDLHSAVLTFEDDGFWEYVFDSFKRYISKKECLDEFDMTVFSESYASALISRWEYERYERFVSEYNNLVKKCLSNIHEIEKSMPYISELADTRFFKRLEIGCVQDSLFLKNLIRKVIDRKGKMVRESVIQDIIHDQLYWYNHENIVKKEYHIGTAKCDLFLSRNGLGDVAIEIKRAVANYRDAYQTYEYKRRGKVNAVLIAKGFKDECVDASKETGISLYEYDFATPVDSRIPCGFYLRNVLNPNETLDYVINEMESDGTPMFSMNYLTICADGWGYEKRFETIEEAQKLFCETCASIVKKHKQNMAEKELA